LSIPPLIAIVDDDEAVREALFDLLQVESLSCLAFESASAFLAHYVSKRFACLVTDIRMPGVDGLELQQQLRALGSDLPVIFITSATEEATRARALECGAAAYLTKPVADGVLLGEIRSVIGGGGGTGGGLPES
jgi:two-component system response regulator FixJ